jgi:hypothetical protein
MSMHRQVQTIKDIIKTVILFKSSSITDNPLVLYKSPNPTLYYTLETNNTIKSRFDWNTGGWHNFYTGQLDEFEDTASGDKKLMALLYDNFLVGCLDTTPQRFLFGLLDDISGDLQGVYSSSAANSSGVADDSGVFEVKRDPDAAAGQQNVCVYFRQRGGQFDNKCVQDPGNKLRIHRTIICRLPLIFSDKSHQEIELDQMILTRTDITHTLDNEFSIHGKKVTDGAQVRLSLKVAEFNYSNLRKATLKFGKFYFFLRYLFENCISTLLDKLEQNVNDQWVSIHIAAAGDSAGNILYYRKENAGNFNFYTHLYNV